MSPMFSLLLLQLQFAEMSTVTNVRLTFQANFMT